MALLLNGFWLMAHAQKHRVPGTLGNQRPTRWAHFPFGANWTRATTCTHTCTSTTRSSPSAEIRAVGSNTRDQEGCTAELRGSSASPGGKCEWRGWWSIRHSHTHTHAQHEYTRCVWQAANCLVKDKYSMRSSWKIRWKVAFSLSLSWAMQARVEINTNSTGVYSKK